MKRKRKFRSATEARKVRENKAAWQNLLKKYPVAKKLEVVKVPEFMTPKVRRETKHYPDNFLQRMKKLPFEQKEYRRLNSEMALREAKAQEEIARKKMRVAPLANKMGYQYVSDGIDVTTIGKKV